MTATALMFHSQMPFTSQWKAINLDGKSVKDAIEEYSHREFYVGDADNCGDETIEFVVRQDGKPDTFYSVYHNWWITYDPEWEIHNEIEIETINSVRFKYPTKDRDWLKLKRK